MNNKHLHSIAQKHNPPRPPVKNCLMSFLFGGSIRAFGQCISLFYLCFFDFSEETVGDPTVATLILLTMFLTGFGVYDIIAQVAGAGSMVPVTGFGNTVISSAIEHKSEGYVIGVGGNIFKLAGSMIAFGVFASFVVALIKLLSH